MRPALPHITIVLKQPHLTLAAVGKTQPFSTSESTLWQQKAIDVQNRVVLAIVLFSVLVSHQFAAQQAVLFQADKRSFSNFRLLIVLQWAVPVWDPRNLRNLTSGLLGSWTSFGFLFQESKELPKIKGTPLSANW